VTVERTAIAGLFVVRWDTHGDERGFFRQTYQRSELEEALGRAPTFRQGNHSRSGAGVLRGLPRRAVGQARLRRARPGVLRDRRHPTAERDVR
jgi:dTDP-4-dehydrorhamnose 3,5-epimerase-like enzyme